MIKYLSSVFIILILTRITCLGQITQAKYNQQQLRLKFPFAEAAKVKIVSFWVKKHSKAHDEMSIPKNEGTNEVDIQKFEETLTLTNPQTDTLSDLLYNSYYRAKDLRQSNMRCYDPRNAILFYDKKDRLIAYIEICFECYKLKASTEKVFLEKTCDETYSGLHNFFLKHGVKTSIYEYMD